MSIRDDLSVAVVMRSAFISSRFGAVVLPPGVADGGGGGGFLEKCLEFRFCQLLTFLAWGEDGDFLNISNLVFFTNI